jgi:hypothetical protein
MLNQRQINTKKYFLLCITGYKLQKKNYWLSYNKKNANLCLAIVLFCVASITHYRCDGFHATIDLPVCPTNIQGHDVSTATSGQGVPVCNIIK